MKPTPPMSDSVVEETHKAQEGKVVLPCSCIVGDIRLSDKEYGTILQTVLAEMAGYLMTELLTEGVLALSRDEARKRFNLISFDRKKSLADKMHHLIAETRKHAKDNKGIRQLNYQLGRLKTFLAL